ncbi:hypothetical protein CFI10_00520 [Marinobacterium iners]|uniref:hypothetical protein n=1 Tax=Marinobacterium iners TaxID=48076 RepID=UPI001A8F806B|nr:hypothetical protein [Marinobacterium iners]QSR33493.1 hypothetical protein CFI10_00520 [Marinobacterium iners]
MMATRAFTFRALQATMFYNNTRQGYAACSTLKPAGYSFPVNTPAKPMPSSVGTLKSCGFFISAALLSHLPKAHQVTSSRSKHPSGQNFYPLNALKGDQA